MACVKTLDSFLMSGRFNDWERLCVVSNSGPARNDTSVTLAGRAAIKLAIYRTSASKNIKEQIPPSIP